MWLTYPDGDILGSREEPIDQDTHEGRVETVFDRELGELGVGHALGDDDSTDSNTWSDWVRQAFLALQDLRL